MILSSCLSQILSDKLLWFTLLRSILPVFRVLQGASTACVCLLLQCHFKDRDIEHNSTDVFITSESIVEYRWEFVPRSLCMMMWWW